jgi:hypothetical protein
MWRTQLLRFTSTLGLVAALGVVAAPAAHAQDRGDHHQAGVYAQRDDGDRGDRGGPQGDRGQAQEPDRGGPQGDRGPDQGDRGDRGDHDDRDRGQFAPPVYVAPPPVYRPPIVEPVPVPVPITPDLNGFVLPPLEALFPAADFADYPPSLLPLGNNVYALSSPMLFWPPDQAGTPEALVAQLDQSSPGWGTTVLDGPEGYGVYLTYQPYA